MSLRLHGTQSAQFCTALQPPLPDKMLTETPACRTSIPALMHWIIVGLLATAITVASAMQPVPTASPQKPAFAAPAPSAATSFSTVKKPAFPAPSSSATCSSSLENPAFATTAQPTAASAPKKHAFATTAPPAVASASASQKPASPAAAPTAASAATKAAGTASARRMCACCVTRTCRRYDFPSRNTVS